MWQWIENMLHLIRHCWLGREILIKAVSGQEQSGRDATVLGHAAFDAMVDGKNKNKKKKEKRVKPSSKRHIHKEKREREGRLQQSLRLLHVLVAGCQSLQRIHPQRLCKFNNSTNCVSRQKPLITFVHLQKRTDRQPGSQGRRKRERTRFFVHGIQGVCLISASSC